jgi:hypothetical protein
MTLERRKQEKGLTPLEITLPKAPEVKPKKITVASKRKEEATDKKKGTPINK